MKHLACIMDGNRRWAQKRGKLPWLGHSQGVEACQRVVEFCLIRNIPYLSLYTFSLENFTRPLQELDYLFGMMKSQAQRFVDRACEQSVAIRFIGDRTKFPKNLVSLTEYVENETCQGSKLQLNLLFCYGGRQEITLGIRAIVRKIKEGLLAEEEIDDRVIEQHLLTYGIPEPDLIIRTGGSQRLSNFLLYQAAYAEFYFTDCLWPDITHEHLEHATAFFDNCRRNFGT